jgi:hypothetical protein
MAFATSACLGWVAGKPRGVAFVEKETPYPGSRAMVGRIRVESESRKRRLRSAETPTYAERGRRAPVRPGLRKPESRMRRWTAPLPARQG